jgi:hypothetical protein
MKPAAAILDDRQLARLLARLGLPTDFPKLAPARSPPGLAGEDSQVDPGEDSHEGGDWSPPDEVHDATAAA